MSTFALCSRESVYAISSAQQEESHYAMIPTPKKYKQRKWTPFDLHCDAQTPPLDDAISEGAAYGLASSFLPPSHTPTSSQHSGRAPTNQKPSKKQQRKMVTPRTYIPPHLRKRSREQPVPPRDSPTPLNASNGAPEKHIMPPSPPASVKPSSPKMQPSKYNSRPHWPKKTVWPKNRDMKPLPSNDDSDGGVSFKSNSDGDPWYDVRKLVDWNGDWLPPSVEWADRKSFTDRHFAQHIEEWAHQIDAAYGGDDHGSVDVYADEYKSFTDSSSGELAIRSWIPAQIEGDSPVSFWKSLPARAPAPLSEIDLHEVQPWWELYQDANHCLLVHSDVPEACIDPNDIDNLLPGVRVTSDIAVQRKELAFQEAIRRAKERQTRPVQNPTPPPIPDISLKPTANIYLRPVYPSDVPQITALYNYYVIKEISANEFNPRTHSQITDRIDDITSRGLPWIVAVLRGNNQARRQKNANFVTETIVGFADIDDYCDAGSMYRFTYELEIYVHHEYLQQGVGSCLFDQLLTMVNPGYLTKGGYDWVRRGEYLEHGCERVVKMVNFSYPHEKTADVEWLGQLLREFGFRRAGHLKGVGFKFGKRINVSIYQHETTETIEAHLKPNKPL